MADSPEDKKYRRFFQQIDVLDALRVYIDLSEEFFEELQVHRILSQDQISFIRTLAWPSSRNELLQMFVKKDDWRRSCFEQFYAIIVQTQKSVLVDLLSKNLNEIVPADANSQMSREIRNISTPITPSDPMFQPLNLQTKMQFSVMMREKDEQLSHLLSRNEYLERTLKIRNTELAVQTTKNERTDRLLENWTAGLQLSDSTASVSELDSQEPSETDVASTLSKVKSSLSIREAKVSKLEGENTILELSLTNLQAECKTLKEQNESLLEEKKRLKEKFVRAMEEMKRKPTASSSNCIAAAPNSDVPIQPVPTSPNTCDKSNGLNIAATPRKPVPKSVTEGKKSMQRKSSDVTRPVFLTVPREEKRRISVPTMSGASGGRSISGGTTVHKH